MAGVRPFAACSGNRPSIRNGEGLALIDGVSGATVTRAELVRRAERAARGLAALGFHRGDCLCAVMPNCDAWYVAFLAAQTLGGTISGINPLSTLDEMVRQFSRVPAKAVIASAQFLDVARAAAARAGISVVLASAGDAPSLPSLPDLDGPPLKREQFPVFPDDPALFPFSSGTIGLPKAVVLSSRHDRRRRTDSSGLGHQGR